MKTLQTYIMTAVMSLGLMVHAQDDHYLKIQFDTENSEVNYPPNTKFVLQDDNEKVVLSPSILKEINEFEINDVHDLYVFTDWNPEPDYFRLKQGKISFAKSKEVKKEPKKNFQFKKNTYGTQLAIKKKRIFSSKDGQQSNLSLVFENGIIFYYRDGKAQAWLDGKALKIDGKYIIESPLGTLKISYDPYTTDVWYVFEAKN